MSEYQPNFAGPALAQALPLSFPQQTTSAPYQAPSALMDQVGYFPHYTNQHEFSAGLNTSVAGDISQVNSQQPKMGNSLPTSHNANAAVSTPVVVNSRQFSPTQQAYEPASPSTPLEVANSGPENLILNQASVDIQPFMISSQVQGMQTPFAYPHNHMGVNGMPIMGGMQTGSMGMQSPSMGYVQDQYANNPMVGFPPGSMMGYGQNQPQFIANSQAFLGAYGMYGANSMQNMQSSCMIGVQPSFQNNAQQAQGFHPHTPSTLRPTASTFTPSQGNLAEQQQMASSANMQFQSQGLVCAPLAAFQHAQGFQHTPITRDIGMDQKPQSTQVSPTSNLIMRQSPKGQCSMRKPIRKHSPKCGRATQPGENGPKRRCKPSDNTVLTKSNIEFKTDSPMSRVQIAMRRVVYGKALPQGVKQVDMTAKPKPDIPIADYLSQPQQLPGSPLSLEVQQPTSQIKIVQPRTSSIELTSSQLTSRHHALTPPTPPSVQPLPPSPAQHSATTKEKTEKYPLSDKEKTIRDAEARNAPIPPSQRRLVRYERDDPRLQRDSNGEPITPEADMYNVYFVAPPTEISMDTINELVANFRREKQQKQASDAAGNGGNSKTKAAKSKSKPRITPTPTPRAKKGRHNKGVRKLTAESAENITVNKRSKAVTTVSTVSASLSAPAALSTGPIAACHDKNDNVIASQLSFDNITDVERQPISTAEVTIPITASFDFAGSHKTTFGAESVAQSVPADEFNIQQSFTQDASSSDEYNTQPGVLPGQQSPALQPTETTSASDSLQANAEQPLNAVSEVSEASSEDLFLLLAPVQQYNESFKHKPIESNVLPVHESPTTNLASIEPESSFEDRDNSIYEPPTTDLSWFLQTMQPPSLKDAPAGAKSISPSLDLDFSPPIACLQTETPGVSNPDPEYKRTSGHNDISVMTVKIPNAPSMRLEDMPYSPVRSTAPPLAGIYNPPSNPEFKPRDPFNTVLDEGTNKRKMNEVTVTAPNKKPRTSAPPPKLALPQCEVRHGPVTEQ